MIKIITFLILLSSLLFAEDNFQRITIFENESYFINEQDISFIIPNKNLLNYKNENGLIEVIPLKAGMDSLTIFKLSGTSKTYFFEIKSANQSSLSMKKRNRTYVGKITYGYYFDSNKNNGNSLNYYHRILIKDNLKFEFSHSYFDKNKELIYSDLNFYTLSYDSLFFSWYRQAMEPNVPIQYYTTLPFEGYILGKKSLNFELKGWVGNKTSNRKKIDDIYYRGLFYNQKFNFGDVSVSFSQNPDLNYLIPIYKISLRDYFLNLSTSMLDNQQISSISFYKDLNSEKSYFSLKKIDFVYAMAPNGSYNLEGKDFLKKDSLTANLYFTNKETLSEEDIQRSDFLPGTSFVGLGFSNTNVDIINSQRVNLNSSYGGIERATLSLETSFSRSLIDSQLKEESFRIMPKINLTIFGNKSDGLFLRNHYIVDNSYDYFQGKEINSFSNNFGLYKNSNRFFYGMYIGSGLVTSETETKLKNFGAEFNFYRKNNVFKAIYSKQISEKSSVESLGLNAFFNYSQDFVFKAGLKFVHQENQNANLTHYVGTMGFTWIFGAGQYPLYNQIKNLNTKIKGKVFLDKNLSLSREDDEEIISNIDLFNYGSPISINNGEFEISSIEDQLTKLTLDSDKYAIYNPVFQSKSGTNLYNVSLYEKSTKDVFLKMNGVSVFDANIQFVCDGKLKNFKTEIFSEKVVVDFPKNMNCFIQLSVDETKYLIKDVNYSEKTINVELERNFKKLFISFSNKIYPIKINKKEYNKKDIEYSIENDSDVQLDLPEKCSILPKVETKIIFSQLKNQNFYNINCK